MWFTVPIYLRCSEPVNDESLFEEAIHLIKAGSPEEAIEKAHVLGNKLDHRYSNVHGKEVRWSVDKIGEPWELLDDLRDGAEIHSRFLK